MKIGTNLMWAKDWIPHWIFVNLIKTARGPMSQRPKNLVPVSDGRVLDLDADGYPKSLLPDQAASFLVCNALEGHYPAGNYICRHKGIGDLWFGGDVTAFVKEANGQYSLTITPSDRGSIVQIVATDPNDPLTELELIPADLVDHPSRFHPLFIHRLKGFASIRCMDLLETNNSINSKWEDRTPSSYVTQQRKTGVAWEHLVALANELECDLYINIPHAADDDYIVQLATLLKASLKTKVWLEYSNEVWNSAPSFKVQFDYCTTQGVGLGANPSQNRHRFQVKRSLEIFNIFETVFGGTGRMVRVVCGQTGNPSALVDALSQNHEKVDAVGIGAYFGGSIAKPGVWPDMPADLDTIFQRLAESIALSKTKYAEYITAMQPFAKKVFAYEGGPALVAEGSWRTPEFKTLLASTQSDKRFYNIVIDWANAMSDVGIDWANYYAYCYRPSDFGSWGMLRYQDDKISEAPKYRGITSRAARTNRITIDSDSWTKVLDGEQSSVAMFVPMASLEIAVNSLDPIRLVIFWDGQKSVHMVENAITVPVLSKNARLMVDQWKDLKVYVRGAESAL